MRRIPARSILKVVSLTRPLRVPGLPTVPRFLALVALSHPRLVPRALRWKAASRGLGLVVARLVAAESDQPDEEAGRGVGPGCSRSALSRGKHCESNWATDATPENALGQWLLQIGSSTSTPRSLHPGPKRHGS